MPSPEVDFKKEMVLAAFMGEQNTGGYAVEIKDAVEEKGKLLVTVLERSPGPDGIALELAAKAGHEDSQVVVLPRVLRAPDFSQ